MVNALRGLRHSLRGRLLAGTIVWVMASVLAAGWALSDLFQQHITRQLTAELTIYENQLIAGLTVDDQGTAALRFEPSDPRLHLPYSGLYWQMDKLDPAAAPEPGVFRSRSLWDQTLQLPPDADTALENELLAFTGPRGHTLLAKVRTVTPPEGSSAYRLIVAADESAISGPMSEFGTMLIFSLGLLALGLAGAAVVQVIVGLRPMAELRQRLANVRAGDASKIEGRFPSEVQPLVDEFNAVLQSNNEIVKRARTQAGNLAHALKTPLSVLGNASENDTSAFGRLVAEQVDVARRQVEHHLARARAAAAVRTPGMRTEVLPVLQGLARVLSRLYVSKGVQLELDDIEDGWVFRGEQQDLQEMMGNLMDNACKWADRTVRVSVAPAAESPDDMLCLCVEDDGHGLPEVQLKEIFRRGVRMDERTPGSGLGLAIVQDLANAYGGSVEASASELGGLRVSLVLPGGR